MCPCHCLDRAIVSRVHCGHNVSFMLLNCFTVFILVCCSHNARLHVLRLLHCFSFWSVAFTMYAFMVLDYFTVFILDCCSHNAGLHVVRLFHCFHFSLLQSQCMPSCSESASLFSFKPQVASVVVTSRSKFA